MWGWNCPFWTLEKLVDLELSRLIWESAPATSVSLLLVGVSAETSRTGRCLSDAEDIMSFGLTMLAQTSHRSERWFIKTLFKFKVCQCGTNEERAVLLLLTSETRVTVSDPSTSFCLSPLCDISMVVSEIGSIWEEFFPWLQQGAWSLCSSWETRILF